MLATLVVPQRAQIEFQLLVRIDGSLLEQIRMILLEPAVENKQIVDAAPALR